MTSLPLVIVSGIMNMPNILTGFISVVTLPQNTRQRNQMNVTAVTRFRRGAIFRIWITGATPTVKWGIALPVDVTVAVQRSHSKIRALVQASTTHSKKWRVGAGGSVVSRNVRSTSAHAPSLSNIRPIPGIT